MLDLLDELAALLRDSPVLLLAMARPSCSPSARPGAAACPPTRPCRSSRCRPTTRELAPRLLAPRGRDGVARVLEISEGNPLFIEELAASLDRAAGGRELPTSIRGIIAARLDALPTPERRCCSTPSVVGRVFWDGAIEARATARKRPRSSAHSAARPGPARGVSRLRGQRQFRFKHVLIKRHRLSAADPGDASDADDAVARFLEESAVEGGAAADAIAHHWRDAGNADRAVQY